MTNVTETCTYCGRHPYHYIDVGVCLDSIAVVCCSEGIAAHYATLHEDTGPTQKYNSDVA